MKTVNKLVLSGVALLMLTNCKFNGEVNNGDAVVDYHSTQAVTHEIEYSNGGWYPRPDAANFELGLKIDLQSDSKALVTVTVPGCEASGGVAASEYQDLEQLILNSETAISKSGMIDGGDEQVLVHRNDGQDAPYFLRDGDSSYGKRVILDPDASDVRNKIHDIADEVLSKYECAVPQRAITSLVIEQGASVSNVGTKNYSRLNLRADITGDVVELHGEYDQHSQNQTCGTEINETVRSAGFAAAARQISFAHSEMICMIETPINVVYMPRSYTLTYSNGDTDQGYVGCEFDKQIQNAQAFEQYVMSEVNRTAATCVADGTKK